jgi:23S rRNA pseudouridine1911/1915/1917 synthase
MAPDERLMRDFDAARAMMTRVTIVAGRQSARRLDTYVSVQTAHVSRTSAQRWIHDGLITVNDRRAKPAQRIRPGDVISCHVAVREPLPVAPEAIPLEVLHEDAALVVVNKPPGLVMHPAPGHWTGTLLNALVHHIGTGDGVEPSDGRRARPGLVHRLDKGSSGVVVIAKTDAAHRDLSRQFRTHSVHRVYLALVAGAVRRGGMIDRALGRDTRNRRRVSIRSAAPRAAVTELRVAERLGRDATLVEARPRTGRMHQIRVHLASIGHPVLGDSIYGDAGANLELGRPMLHAVTLGFIHPSTGEYQEYHASLPPDMECAVAHWRRARPSDPGHAGGRRQR